MATFVCLRSGNTIELTQEDDIVSTRAHEGYKEIQDEKAEEIQVEVPAEKEVLKKRGRPFKVN